LTYFYFQEVIKKRFIRKIRSFCFHVAQYINREIF